MFGSGSGSSPTWTGACLTNVLFRKSFICWNSAFASFWATAMVVFSLVRNLIHETVECGSPFQKFSFWDLKGSSLCSYLSSRKRESKVRKGPVNMGKHMSQIDRRKCSALFYPSTKWNTLWRNFCIAFRCLPDGDKSLCEKSRNYFLQRQIVPKGFLGCRVTVPGTDVCLSFRTSLMTQNGQSLCRTAVYFAFCFEKRNICV